ncbi:MAG: type II toxin-antitoxin system VapC family toxin [Rhodanobacteraceae bacterium]|nr:type II toxin-antitoxin system VapC family toxin [Rhodanobacteraceae bacterium]MBK7042832.1 type II toxin-antitoxin system VapC family toxin [Rhodanobacteraceae bacterium]MBP9154667.1 type II toxin-antitoxin system VapC family toxin [Xanthomonadales bacterium]HQW80270.1 type II toxin-antitoxin system VapC family toxin [Pseudomonadota bacterium]
MSAARQALVLDASLALSWALPDEASAYCDDVLDKVAVSGAVVPGLWTHEMANGLLMAQRRGRLTTAQRMAFVEQLLHLAIEVEISNARSVLDGQVALAERYALTAYDAAYLDLALRRGFPLATQDKAMKVAARKAGVVLVER